jgi:protochlorophyllide reductase
MMPVPPAVKPYLDALPSAGGKRAVVTGGNTGLGRETVRYLALKGAAVVIAARELAKAEEARAAVLRDVPGASITTIALDLSSLASVERCAARLAVEPIDLLVCNAGIMALDRSETEDGFEAQLGVNHLGHFALVGRLLGALTARSGSRIVSVTSGAGFNASIDFDDLMGERKYDRWRAYGQSKLANMLFTSALARRLHEQGATTTAHAAHPGLVFTQLQRNVLDTAQGLAWWEPFFLSTITPAFGQGVEMGALPQVYAALAPQAENGDLWGPRWTARGRPVQIAMPRPARDVTVQDRLWRVSEELTGVAYGVSTAPA